MAIHPTNAGALTGAQFQRMATMSAVAHSLAMVSFLAIFLGACGLARVLHAPDRLAFAAVVIFGFAAVAIMIATSVSGFILPEVLRRMLADTPGSAPMWRITASSIFQINQAFARIYSVAAASSVLLFSTAIWKGRALGRGLAIYGCISAPIVILAITSGVLPLNVHGMAIVVVAQSIWFVGAGAQLCQAGVGPALHAAVD